MVKNLILYSYSIQIIMYVKKCGTFRKIHFPFAFCSLIRNFVGEKTIDV